MRLIKKCYVCGKPMTSLCDATNDNGKPCDRPMCEEHRNRVGSDLDVCEHHDNPNDIQQAEKNRQQREEARKYFIEEYRKQDFRVVPGHWPDFANKDEVDKWIDIMSKLSKSMFDKE